MGYGAVCKLGVANVIVSVVASVVVVMLRVVGGVGSGRRHRAHCGC